MNKIHPTAIIGQDVKLGDNITIEPYAVLDGDITIGDHCHIAPFVHITGWVTIGKNTKIFAAAAIGEAPQDYSFDGIKGLVEIGENCTIREYVTIHTPIKGDTGEKTVIGNNAFLMVNSHVGHNSIVGEHAILTNGCLLAGFVKVEEHVVLSGNTAVHQHCRIGAYSMIGGLTKIVQDVPPFLMVDGSPALAHGLNIIGLRRKGFNQEERNIIKEAYRIIYSGNPMKENIALLEERYPSLEIIRRYVDFLKLCKRGIVGNANNEE